MNSVDAQNLIKKCKDNLSSSFEWLDEISLYNQEKVLNAFMKNKVSLYHFNGTTGYGYNDVGRDTLKRVYADVFNAQNACITPNIVSGTHAISLALFAVLESGQKVLSASGTPYDTFKQVIEGDRMSLKTMGVTFDYVDLIGDDFDYDKISALNLSTYSLVYVQRSRGYALRPVLSIAKMQKFFEFLRKNKFNGIIFVDNCYGEFVEKFEPTDVGADLIAGSLIKNIGGGIAPTGGYVVGNDNLISLVEARLTSPSIAGEVGSYAFGYQYFYQGLFLAPHVVNQALKGSMLLGACMSELGYDTTPKAYEVPFDITRSIVLGDKQKLIDFIQSVQSASPVDSYVTLEPAPMPGYEDEVIMAAGSFVQGSSIELSCDAPIKEPFVAYIQGGLTIEHCIVALKKILQNL